MRSNCQRQCAPLVITVLAAIIAGSMPRAHADEATQVTFSAELGATVLTGHPNYVFGTGTSLGLGVSLHDRLSFEWTTSQHSMRAKDGLHAANTLGRLKANAVMMRLRLPLLPLTLGAGIGQTNVPLLTLNDEGLVSTTGVRQLGALASGALLLVRSKKFSVYVEGRLFLPLLREIPPSHFPAQSSDAVYPSTESKAYPALTLGLGMRMAL